MHLENLNIELHLVELLAKYSSPYNSATKGNSSLILKMPKSLDCLLFNFLFV